MREQLEIIFENTFKKYDWLFEWYNLKCFDAFYHYDERFTEEENNSLFYSFCDNYYEDFVNDCKEVWFDFEKEVKWNWSSFQFTERYDYDWHKEDIFDEIIKQRFWSMWYNEKQYILEDDAETITRMKWWVREEEVEGEEYEKVKELFIKNFEEEIENILDQMFWNAFGAFQIFQEYKEWQLENYKNYLFFKFEEKEVEREEKEEKMIEDIEKIFPELQGSITEEKRRELIEYIDHH